MNISNIISNLWIILTIFIVICGLYFSKCINFMQVFNIKKVFKNTFGKIKEGNSYTTIMSVLGGTVGSGNIAGIATGIAIGGVGAIFWMWVVALISMGNKFAEVTLAVYYQKKDKNKYYGGPMYYIKEIKGNKGKYLSIFYACALFIYVLCNAGFVQANTISTSLNDTFNMSNTFIGICLLLMSYGIIKGGINAVSKVLKSLVPFMCILYILISLIIIGINYTNIIPSIKDIFIYAFKPQPIIGGFMGSSILLAISKGSSRGILSNEAGTGTSTTVHATSKNKPVIQGMWGIVEVYIVSFVICTITALLITTTNAYQTGLTGSPMVLEAFNTLGSIGKYILCFMICLFAYSTYIGFFYEYNTCIRYLFKDKIVLGILKYIYLIPILLAVYMPINKTWLLSDISVGLIIIPNLISLLILSPKLKSIIKEYNYAKEN